MEKSYNNQSITSLKGADRVRLRPAVIFGSDGHEGCQHSFFEILSNSIDEAREGYGKVIEVTKFSDGSLMVKDNGRGIPLEYNEKEKRYNWELVFCEMYAGGKYKNNEEGNYEYSLGLNGLGTCATQYSSKYMDVTVYRDGYEYKLHFEKGENVGGLSKTKIDSNRTGTIIKWLPDLEVFTDIDVSVEYLQNVLKKQAIVNANIKFKLYIEETNERFEYIYKNGIIDYVKELNQKGLTDVFYFKGEDKGRDRADKPEYKVKFEFAFAFNNEVNLLEYYHNSSFLEHGGAPEKALKLAFLSEFDNFIKSQNKYNKNEKKISFSDIEDSLIAVTNSFSTLTSYENQTKKAITNKFIQTSMTNFIKHHLELWIIENKIEAEKVANQLLINKRSRENAEKAKLNIKKKLSSKMDSFNRVKKFVDCRSKEKDKRELYIVEGDSALGSVKLGRDANFQAVIPVRGKILNCLKADLNKIFSNEIILDLLRVIGAGVEIQTKHSKDFSTFNMDKMPWSKIVICTDADVDGYQIRTLILAMFYRLLPTLMKEGKVYIAETPLFEITSGKDTYFAYDEKEKKEILFKLKNKRYTIQRSKGLGENDPDMMWTTTMNPQTRRLLQVTPDDDEYTKEMFGTLLGDDLDSRKSFIAENGHEYIDMLDVM